MTQAGWRGRLDARRHGLRVQLRDVLELWLLPGSAALLPWGLGFRWLRLLARWPWLYRQATASALSAASAHGLVSEAEAWAREHRLMMLVDHADLFLSRTRSDRWLARYVDVHGRWPDGSAPGLLVTFHWAAGMWAHRHARASGLKPHMLLARTEGGDYARRGVLRRYAAARARAVAQADGRPVIFVPGAMAELRQAWAQDEQVIVVIDVPPDQVRLTAPQTVLGRRAHMPIGLPRLAVAQGVPVTVFTLGFDLRTGRRDLRLYRLGVWEDEQALNARIFEHFDHIVQERPACWHFWSVAGRFFADRG